MLASHRLDAPVIFSSLLAFLCFSLIASSVYILNDLHDLSADRAHPRKRRRPIAAGEISIGNGLYMAAGLLAFGAILSSTLGLSFVLIIVGYYTLTLAYSLDLKKRIVVDIFVLASLYTIRMVAGGAATGIHLSLWLLAFSVFFFLALAAVKRQAELIDSAKRGHLKANGRGYHVDDLPIISMIAISAGYGSVLVMMMYVNSPEVLKLYAYPEALWGVCVVLFYWITRTVMIAHRGEMNDDPVVFAAKDRVSLVCLLITLGIILTGSFA
jgi:4-hydroxybenzoate polyprenyltransferase